MNSFREFVISKLPLLVDDKLHIEAGELFRLHDEWIKEQDHISYEDYLKIEKGDTIVLMNGARGKALNGAIRDDGGTHGFIHANVKPKGTFSPYWAQWEIKRLIKRKHDKTQTRKN